jgi:chromosome segregation ATPase
MRRKRAEQPEDWKTGKRPSELIEARNEIDRLRTCVAELQAENARLKSEIATHPDLIVKLTLEPKSEPSGELKAIREKIAKLKAKKNRDAFDDLLLDYYEVLRKLQSYARSARRSLRRAV